MIHYPEPKKLVAPSVERTIIAATVVFILAAGGIITVLYSQFRVPSVIFITLTACFIIPTIALVFLGYRDTFDPWSLTCYMGLMLFVVSPLLHLFYRDPGLPTLPYHFEPLLRVVAWSSVPIIPLLYMGHRVALRNFQPLLKPYRRANPVKMLPIGLVMAVVGTISFIVYYAYMQEVIMTGIGGRLIILTAGSVLILADGAILGVLLIVYALMLRNLGLAKKLRILDTVLIVIVCALVIVANVYRGSRAKMLLMFAWAACLYNQFVRRISLVMIIVAWIILMPLMTIYKVSKVSDFTDLGELITNPEYRASQTERYKASSTHTLIANLGRSYIWMLYLQELKPGGNIDRQWGKTYVAALLMGIPRWLYPTKPRGIVNVTVDAQYGRGKAKATPGSAAMVAGIWAEGYANFGFLGIWAAAFIYGLVIGYAKRFFARREPSNIFHFMFFIAASMGPYLLLSDLRGVIWNFSRVFILLVPLLWWASDPAEPELEDLVYDEYHQDEYYEDEYNGYHPGLF